MTHCETEASAEKRGKGKREELYKMYVLNMFDRYLKRVSTTALLTHYLDRELNIKQNLSIAEFYPLSLRMSP